MAFCPQEKYGFWEQAPGLFVFCKFSQYLLNCPLTSVSINLVHTTVSTWPHMDSWSLCIHPHPHPTPRHLTRLPHRAARLIWLLLHKSDPVISFLNMIFTITPNSSTPPERLCLSGSVLPYQPLLDFSACPLSPPLDSEACCSLDPRAFARAVSVCLANSHQSFRAPPQHRFLRPALQVIPA